MTNGFRFFLVAAALGMTLASTGCAPPCDRYCDITAKYIEACLEIGTQPQWIEAKETGFGYWGYADATEFEAECKTDFDGQLAAAADPAVLTQACEDEANDWALLEGRGQCAELP